MKTGKSLSDFAALIQNQMNTKKDYVVSTSAVTMTEDLHLQSEIFNTPITPICHDQISDRLDIPRKYYRKMYSFPALLASNVNHWFQSKNQKRMIRTLDGNARAFLSDRYRPIDNYDIAGSVLPAIYENGLQVVSADVTDRKMYLKCINYKKEDEITKGDVVCAGAVISNSEIGMGRYSVQPFVERLVCTNGLILPEFSVGKNHIGRNIAENDIEVYSNETIKQDNKALLMRMKDVFLSALQDTIFDKIVGKLRESTEQAIERNPVEVISEVSNKFRMSEDEAGNVLKHLAEGGSMSKYGLVNAITRTAEDIDSYDRATEFESFGGQLLSESNTEWKKLSVVQ